MTDIILATGPEYLHIRKDRCGEKSMSISLYGEYRHKPNKSKYAFFLGFLFGKKITETTLENVKIKERCYECGYEEIFKLYSESPIYLIPENI